MKLPAKVFIFLTAVLVSSCKRNTPAVKHADISGAGQTLDRWHRAAARADFDTYFSLMDDEAVFVGTDSSEVWTKAAFMQFAKPYFERGKAWTFIPLHRNLYSDATHSGIVWFDETLDTWMGICRGSGVLVRKDDIWLIKHFVLSLTVPNEKITEVISVLQRDSTVNR